MTLFSLLADAADGEPPQPDRMIDQIPAAANRQGWVEVSDAARLPAKPVVSVSMLAYNHGSSGRGHRERVAVVQQTDFPIELIIGEDCSSDNTQEIALHYQREYPHVIRLILSDRNAGMYANSRRVLNCAAESSWRSARGMIIGIIPKSWRCK